MWHSQCGLMIGNPFNYLGRMCRVYLINLNPYFALLCVLNILLVCLFNCCCFIFEERKLMRYVTCMVVVPCTTRLVCVCINVLVGGCTCTYIMLSRSLINYIHTRTCKIICTYRCSSIVLYSAHTLQMYLTTIPYLCMQWFPKQ